MLIIGNLLQLEGNFLKDVNAEDEIMKVIDAIVYHFTHSSSHTSLSVGGKYIAFALKKVSLRSVTFATKSISKKGNISLLYENQVIKTYNLLTRKDFLYLMINQESYNFIVQFKKITRQKKSINSFLYSYTEYDFGAFYFVIPRK